MIIVLAVTNFYTFMNSREYKKNLASFPESDELNVLSVNFKAGIKNNNLLLKDITVKDSLNNIILLQNFFKTGQSLLFVCRYSELNCESCVAYSIQALLQWVDVIGKDNILFLGSYRNNRMFNKYKRLYGLDTLNVVNTPALNLPAEDLGYPYYFVLDSAMRVTNVFVPDKSCTKISKWYLELVNEKFHNSHPAHRLPSGKKLPPDGYAGENE
jgi:hypothetical protein